MDITAKEIIGCLEELAPPSYAESWDNVGLLIGDMNGQVRTILLALDAIPEVVEEAIHHQADMIITHHPMVFKPLKAIRRDTDIGNRVYKLIQNNISLYAAHTNLDICFGGTNDILAQKLGLTDTEVLHPLFYEIYKKIVVFVPKTHIETVRSAMTGAGAGYIGSYSDCTFAQEGIGTFRPLEGTNPHIGTLNHLEKVEEVRLETIAPEKKVSSIIQRMLESHPYEEAAYDIYPVDQKGKAFGIGRIGILQKRSTLEEYAQYVKSQLNLSHIRLVGDSKTLIQKIALCSGSGMEYMKVAAAQKADVYVTSDVKFHEAQEALGMNLCIIDGTHYGTENIVVSALSEYLQKQSMMHQWDIRILVSEINGQPFQVL